MGRCGAAAATSSILLKTLRNAQVRRISWVRRVRPAAWRCEWPPHRRRLRPATSLSGRYFHAMMVGNGARGAAHARLFDLRLAEFHVLLRDRVVFLLGELVGHGARILLGHVIEAGVRARHQLDLDGGGLRHDAPLKFRRKVAVENGKSM